MDPRLRGDDTVGPPLQAPDAGDAEQVGDGGDTISRPSEVKAGRFAPRNSADVEAGGEGARGGPLRARILREDLECDLATTLAGGTVTFAFLMKLRYNVRNHDKREPWSVPLSGWVSPTHSGIDPAAESGEL